MWTAETSAAAVSKWLIDRNKCDCPWTCVLVVTVQVLPTVKFLLKQGAKVCSVEHYGWRI